MAVVTRAIVSMLGGRSRCRAAPFPTGTGRKRACIFVPPGGEVRLGHGLTLLELQLQADRGRIGIQHHVYRHVGPE